MQILDIRTLSGPNVYSHHPAMVMTLDLGALDKIETCQIKGFVDRLLNTLPGLHDHHCSLGRPGGFVERLDEGTYFGHTVEHVALELTSLAGIGATHGKTREAGEPRVYKVAIEYISEKPTRYLLTKAVELVEQLARNEECSIVDYIKEARRLKAEEELGPSTRAIVDAAEKRGIPWCRKNDHSLIQLGYGKNLHHIQAAMTDQTSATAVELAQDKEQTKALLRKACIPVPDGEVVYSIDEALQAMAQIGAPVVVKPLTGRQGLGVSLDVSTEEELRNAFHSAAEHSDAVLIEKTLNGRNYRVLVVNNKVVAASERVPCQITGDGKKTIRELVLDTNADPLRGDGHEKPLTKIQIDNAVVAHLRREKLELSSVPAFGEVVTLSLRTNLSAGATAYDVTDDMHPSIRMMCERVARLIGLDICGIDLIADDIASLSATAVFSKSTLRPACVCMSLPLKANPAELEKRSSRCCIQRVKPVEFL